MTRLNRWRALMTVVILTGLAESAAAQSSTTTTLKAAGSTVTLGQQVSLQANVSPYPSANPADRVTFYDGMNILGTAAVSRQGNQGIAQLSAGLSAGKHALYAYFSGRPPTLSPSRSAEVTVQVNAVPSAMYQSSGGGSEGQINSRVVVADLNADGIPDLVTGTAQGFHVLFGDGKGKFTLPFSTPGCSPDGLAVGDLDFDGNPEIVVVCTGIVNIYRRSSFVAWSKASSFSASSTLAASPVIADFNADGIPDLLVTGGIYYGTGLNLGFTPSNLPVASLATKVIAAKFNGDPYPDLAWISGTAVFAQMSIGNGSLAAPIMLPVAGGTLTDLISGDFNGDLKADLAAASPGGRIVSVWLGDGNGGFQARKDIPTSSPGNMPLAIATAEFDGDGKPDLVVCQKSSNQFEILRGDGSGGFQGGFVYLGSGDCNAIAVGDLNLDGRADIAMARVNFGGALGNSPIAVVLGIGAARMTAWPSNNPQSAEVSKPFGNALGVRVWDAADSPMSGVYVTFGVPASGPSAVLTPPLATSGGQVSITAVANQVANASNTSYQATASLAGVEPVKFTLMNRPGPASSVKAIGGGGQSRTVGLIFPTKLQAIVVDAYGNNTGDQVSFFAPPSPSAGLTGTQVNGAGISFTDATADTVAGTYQVSGKFQSLPAATFTLTNLADTPSSITASGGTPQSTASGTNFLQPLQAAVRDKYGNGLPGIMVTFSAAGAGTFQGSAVVPTGLNGVAVAPTLKAGSTLGTFHATASSNAVPGPAAKFDLLVAGATTLTLSASPADTANFGQQVTFTATVAPGAAAGTVHFYDVTQTVAGVLIGSGPLTGGVATFKTILLDAGTHQFRAVFPATGQYLSSTSNTVFLSVKSVPGVSFLPPKTAGVGSGGYRLAVDDLDGDGKPDLVILKTDARGIGVILGNGPGTFRSEVNYAIPGTPDYWRDVAIADVNGDGKLDIVVDAGSGLTVLPGNGDGTFQKPIVSPGGAGGIAIGDFDQDRKPDVVVLHYSRTSVQLMRGLGDGHFTTGAQMNTGDLTLAMLARDFNGDGNLDIVSANNHASSVSVLLGRDDGTFETARNTPTGEEPSALATGDFNGDGMLDLAVGNYKSNNVSILIGNGDGTFRPAVNLPGGRTPSSISAADFDGDGRIDLAVSSANDSSIFLLLGNGDGTFQTALRYSSGTHIENVAADFNGDGRADIAIVDPNGTYVLLAAVPTSVVVATGSPQQKVVNGTFSPLSVKVDANGVFLANVPVTFQVPLSGASAAVNPITIRTGNGVGSGTLGAASAAATANSIAGSYVVNAAVTGTAPAAFLLSNLAGPPASITSTGGTPQAQPINTQFPIALKATVRDAYSNPVPGIAVTYLAPTTSASAGLTSAPLTDASGGTSVTATANSTAGSYSVTAKAAGVATAASFTLTNLMTLTFVSMPSGLAFRVNGSDYVSTSGALAFAAGQSVPVDVPTIIQTIAGQANTKYRFHGWSTPLNPGPAAQSLIVPSTPTGNIGAYFLPQYKLTLVGTATAALVENPSSIPPDSDGYYTANVSGLPAVVAVTGTCIAGAIPTGLSVQVTGSGTLTTIANGGSVTMHAPRTVTVLCPPPPASLSVVSGTPQSAVIGKPFALPLQVIVRDAANNPVQNVNVSFTVPSSGPSAVLSSPVATNSSGVASVIVSANSTVGGYSVIATVAGVAAPATFSLTNLPTTATIALSANYGDAKLSVTVNGVKTDYTGSSGQLTVNSNDTVVFSHPPGTQTPSPGVRYDFYGWSGYITDPVTLTTPIGSGGSGIFYLASYKLIVNGTAIASPSSADGFYMQTPSIFLPVAVTGTCSSGRPVIGLQLTAPAYYPVNGQYTPAGAPITVSNGSVITMDRPWTVDVMCPQQTPEVFWGLSIAPNLATGHANMVWFDADGVPGPALVAATPAIPMAEGVWTSEGGAGWMDAVQAPGQPGVLLVVTTGYGPQLRAFRTDGTTFSPCGAYPMPVLGSEHSGVRVDLSGTYALVVQGASPSNGLGGNILWKFPLNLTASGNCLTGSPIQIAVPSNPSVRRVDFNPATSRQAVLSGYSNVVTFIDPVTGIKLCDVRLENLEAPPVLGTALSRIEAIYRPDGTEVWAAAYDGNQIAVITPPGATGGCTVSQYITAGFGALDHLQGSSFHPDPNVPVYYATSYTGGRIFVINTNSKQVTAGTMQLNGTYPLMTAITRGPVFRLEVALTSGGTLSYDVTTAAQALNPAANALGIHQALSAWRVIHTLRNVGQADADKNNLYAWGRNTFGELGDGTNTNSGPPVKVSGLTGVVSVSGGQLHSLALKSDGKVWAWGDNQYGELGTATNVSSNIPLPVNGLLDVAAISGGSLHSLALTRGGTVWSWGINEEGELGNGGNTNSHTPGPVNGLTGVVAIGAGGYHNLALKNDGTLWAWGLNSNGQLGNGTLTNSNTPLQVSGMTGVVAIAGGQSNSLALKADGTVWSWGWDAFEFFQGLSGNHKTPAVVNGLTGVVAIAAGQIFNLALKSDGTVWAWGHNQNGQLGNGTNEDLSNTPAPVNGLSDVIAIFAGSNHSMALKKDGSLWGWGLNQFSELGSGPIVSYLPVLMNSPPGVVAIGGGENHNIVIVISH